MTERERLINLIKEGHAIANWHHSDVDEGIADHLLSNGVIVPPCKVGDKVYSTLDDLGKLHECRVRGIYIGRKEHEHYVEIEPSNYCGRGYGAAFGAFGKTVFLTREEAEKALARDKNG